jgi:hypothetical protein
MRPKSIVNFERLALLSLAIAAITTGVGWSESMRAAQAAGLSGAVLAVACALGFGLGALLVYLIARKASNVARWVLVVLVGLSFLATLPRIGTMLDRGMVGIAEIAQMLLLVAGVAFLFARDSKPWFDRGRPADAAS